jgi:hypothetical protein
LAVFTEVALRSLRVFLAVVFLCCFSLAEDKPALTFVQITDAHVFDDGWNQPADSGYKSVGDDWASLHWAIEQINGMVAVGEHIDFVIYTGDFGLSNVELRENCMVVPTKVDTRGLPSIKNEWAVRKIASELSTLTVNTVYFVPGNNDLSGEAVTDAARPKCFVKLVQSELASLTPPSSVHFTTLRAANAVSLNGFRLVGFNSGSFKDDANYKDDCPLAGEGCPDVEFAALQKAISATSSEPILLFTHIPDLVDPFRKHATWKITDQLRTEWKAAACDKRVTGIFAGHFHDSDRNLYGSITSTINLIVPGSECVAKKTWVTPPLSIKNQIGKNPTARGLSLVKVFKDGTVKDEVHWY